MRNIKYYISYLYSRLLTFRKFIWPIFAFGVISIILIFAFRSSKVSTYPVGWEKSFPITPFKMSVKNVRITSKGNFIVAVYEGKEKKASGISVSISFDGGRKFFKPIKIADTKSKTDTNPQLAISGDGHIAVVWQSLSGDDPNSRILYTISRDMGASWSEPNRIYLPSDMILLPQVLYDEKGTLHIFYNAFKDRALNLFHVSSNNEKSFDEPQPLINISGLRGAFFPAIHTSGNYIFIVWQGKGEQRGILSDDLYFIKSDDHGESWSSSKRLTFSKAQDSSPYITSYKDVLYLVYQNNESNNWSIKLLKGYEKGDKWDSEPITVSTTNADCFSPLSVSSDNKEMIIIWYDIRAKKPSIFSRKYSISDRKFAKEQRLSRSKSSARKPVAISMGKKVIVLWEEANRIKAKYSDIYVSPPVVYSKTHPKNKWSKLSQARIKWKASRDESKITGYATMLKKARDYRMPDIIPTVQNINGNINELIIPDLEDGISYFYIRAIDGAGNYSRTARYKIHVSSNPPPMPVVISSTHPEGEGVKSGSPRLQWSVDKRVRSRLKGYIYSISKGIMKSPNIFTTRTDINFHDLDTGRHFFNIRSVDRTNTLSRIASYEIIVGSAEELDPSLYGQIAMGVDDQTRIKKRKMPTVEINIPFDTTFAFNQSSFEISITPKNIKKRNINGYSVFIDRISQEPSNRINYTDNVIKANNLKNGVYFIGVKCMYYKVVKGRKLALWTEPVIKRFTISIPDERSPVMAYMDSIIMRLNKSRVAVSISLMTMIFSIVTIGFGTKLTFYAKLFQLRISHIFKIF